MRFEQSDAPAASFDQVGGLGWVAAGDRHRSVNKMIRKTTTIILLALLTGCSRYYHDFELNERSFDQRTMHLIETNIGFQLPAQAHGINFFHKAPIDPSFVAKIEIPAGSKTTVIEQLSSMTNEEVHVSGPVGERFKWWTPSKEMVLVERERCGGDTYYHAILTDDGGRLILYLDWSMDIYPKE